MAPDNIPVTPLPPLVLDAVRDVPEHLAYADSILTRVLQRLAAPALRLSGTGDPVAGVRHATAAADAEARGVVRMPRFTRSPNRVQRHWLAYSLNTAVTLAAVRFLYVNSPLNGSDNLRRWVSQGYMATVRGFRCGALAYILLHVPVRLAAVSINLGGAGRRRRRNCVIAVLVWCWQHLPGVFAPSRCQSCDPGTRTAGDAGDCVTFYMVCLPMSARAGLVAFSCERMLCVSG